ncbi:MAG: cell envelope integrity EipB family protein [Minwuiales bacterium]|nr:cell envelope integrity EipB family protein [Minwuiales bacterium]
MKRLAYACWIALLLPWTAGGQAQAAGLQLASYRAVYDLVLGSADSGSGIADLNGRLVLEWQDVCEGYTFAQRIRTEMMLFSGGPAISDYTVSSWESRDGTEFRFSLKHVMNDRVVETFNGDAELAAPGAEGTVVYTEPEDKQEKLPAGVIFPTEHNILLLKKGIAGETLAVVKVFDGSGDEGLNRATAFIGRQRPPETSEEGAYAPLRGLASWPVRLAYHPLGTADELPAYEVGFRLYENGIPGDVDLVYEDFSISGRLADLEILPTPDC